MKYTHSAAALCLCMFGVIASLSASTGIKNKYGRVDIGKVTGFGSALIQQCNTLKNNTECLTQCVHAVSTTINNNSQIEKLENSESPQAGELAKVIVSAQEQCLTHFTKTTIANSPEYKGTREFIALVKNNEWPKRKLSDLELSMIEASFPVKETDVQIIASIKNSIKNEEPLTFQQATKKIKATILFQNLVKKQKKNTFSARQLQASTEKLVEKSKSMKDRNDINRRLRAIGEYGAGKELLAAISDSCNLQYLEKYRTQYSWVLPKGYSKETEALELMITPGHLQQICFKEHIKQFSEQLDTSSDPEMLTKIESKYYVEHKRHELHRLVPPQNAIPAWLEIQKQWRAKVANIQREKNESERMEKNRLATIKNKTEFSRRLGPNFEKLLLASSNIADNCSSTDKNCIAKCKLEPIIRQEYNFITDASNGEEVRQQRANDLAATLSEPNGCLDSISKHRTPEIRGTSYYTIKGFASKITKQNWPTVQFYPILGVRCSTSENPFHRLPGCNYLSAIYYGDFDSAVKIEYKSTEVYRTGFMGDNLNQLNDMVGKLRKSAGYEDDVDHKQLAELKWKAHSFVYKLLRSYIVYYVNTAKECLDEDAIVVKLKTTSTSYRTDVYGNKKYTNYGTENIKEIPVNQYLYPYSQQISLFLKPGASSALIDQSMSLVSKDKRTGQAEVMIGSEKFKQKYNCKSVEALRFESNLLEYFDYRQNKNNKLLKKAQAL